MKFLTKIFTLLLSFLMIISNLSVFSEEEFQYVDNQELKYIIDENFLFTKNEILVPNPKEWISGWDIRKAGGTFKSVRNKYYTVKDQNPYLPIEMVRKFEPLDHGELTLDFKFKFETDMEGTSWSLNSKDISAIKIMRKNGKLNFIHGENNFVDLGSCIVGKYYGVRVLVSMDTKKCTIYVNGELKAENIDFTQQVQSVDQFVINTGEKAVGDLTLCTVRLHRGYVVNEQLITSQDSIPQDWKVESLGGFAIGSLIESSVVPDIYSFKMNSFDGDVSLSKTFKTQKGKITYKYKMLIPNQTDGVNMQLLNDNTPVLEMTTKNGEFCYINTNGELINIYKYAKNVWNDIKWDIDLDKNLATISINARKVAENIGIKNIGLVNKIKTSLAKSETGLIYVDDFMLNKNYPQPPDYVPEPKAVSNPDYLTGMQMCSLWRDGNHIGWDWINSTPERKTYLGFYDEGSAEVADWEIKWMVEHGVNFQMYCWYNVVANTDQPVKDPMMGWALHDGLFNSKYRDMMKYMILWENVPHDSINAPKNFRDNLIPFWIEHYLKDPNYVTVDGRPIFGIYGFDKFIKDMGSKSQAKEALIYFENECKKAGIKEPFFITSSGGGNGESDVGFDYVYQYTFQMSSWIPEKQKRTMSSQAKKENISVIPSICMGRDDSPWGMGAGGFTTPKQYKDIISWAKNDLIPNSKQKASKPIFLFTTWNEYGEGHFIAPSALEGFGYLDAIRDVFIGEDKHTDVRPTKKQLDRINNLYDSQRKVRQLPVNEKPKTIPTYVRKGWYFDKDGDTEGWSSNGIVKDFNVKDGCLTGSVTGWDPALFSGNLDKFDPKGVTYIKVRMKNAIPDCSGEMYFVTETYGTYTETKGINFEVVANDTEFRDYYVNIYRAPYWREEDRVTQIRIDPTQWGESGNFYIDSIELLSEKPTCDTSLKLNVDSRIIEATPTPFIEDDTAFVSLRNVADRLKCDIDWNNKTKTVSLVKGDKTLQFKNFSNKVFINGKEVEVKKGAVLKDGTTYVPIRFIAETLGLDVEWDSDKNMVIINTPEYIKKIAESELPKKKRKLIKSFEFNDDGDLEGWRTNNQVSGLSVGAGTLNATSTGNDPNFNSPDNLNINASDIKNVAVGLQNSTSGNYAEMFFITNENGSWNEQMRFDVSTSPKNDNIIEYNMNPNEGGLWKGTIRQLRLDPINKSGDIKIDYIRLEGDFEDNEINNCEFSNQPSIKKADKEIIWDFNINTTLDGWIPNKHIANVKTQNGSLFADIIGEKPLLISNSNLNISTTDIKEIVIKYKNSSKSLKAKLYFKTDLDMEITEPKSFEFDVVKDDTISTRYVINPNNNENWKGNLYGFCFMPGAIKSKCEIDYIKIILK